MRYPQKPIGGLAVGFVNTMYNWLQREYIDPNGGLMGIYRFKWWMFASIQMAFVTYELPILDITSILLTIVIGTLTIYVAIYIGNIHNTTKETQQLHQDTVIWQQEILALQR